MLLEESVSNLIIFGKRIYLVVVAVLDLSKTKHQKFCLMEWRKLGGPITAH